MEAELWQEAELHQETKLRRTEVKTTEEREGSGMGASEEEYVRDEGEEKDRDEGMVASAEEINGPNEGLERDDDVSDGEEYVDWDAVRGGGGSEVDKRESRRSNGDEDEE